MHTTRLVAAAAFAVATIGSLATVALADDHAIPAHRSAAPAVDEPPAHRPLPDGTYLGYVRDPVLPAASLAVDLVSLRDGVARNDETIDRLVYAGALADVGLVSDRPEPFWIVVADGAIVGLTTADDVLAPLAARARSISGSITDVADVDGHVTVTIDGSRYEIDSAVAGWVTSHAATRLFVRATLLDGVIVKLRTV